MTEGGHYGIELSFNNHEEGFRLPVNPESIEVHEEGQGKTYNIVGKGGGTNETRAGEINVIQNPKLKEISFSSFFPMIDDSRSYPSYVAVNYVQQPMVYVNYIRKWMESRRPIRFIMEGMTYQITQFKEPMLHDLNFPVSIEKFEWKEVAGSPGDIEYSLTLKEYVFYSAKKAIEITTEDGQKVLAVYPQERPDERVIPQLYKIEFGDTLLHIAWKMYGDVTWANDIRRVNGFTLAQSKRLPEGQMIKLPDKKVGD